MVGGWTGNGSARWWASRAVRAEGPRRSRKGGENMITLDDDQLVFRFPDVHPDATCRIAFQRTLRIPDDNRDHPLPPGLGHFPLRHVDDHAARVPGDLARARRRLPADAPVGGDVGRVRRRVSDGGQGGGREDRRVDRRPLAERAVGRPAGLPRGPRTTVARRVLRTEGADPAVRRHAARRGIHGRGATDRRGAPRGGCRSWSAP